MESHIKEALDEARWLTESLPIRLLGDSVLTTPCEPMTAEEFRDGSAQRVADKLIEFLKAYREKTGAGRGLAANQIGFSKQVILVWLDTGPEIYVNPKVLTTEGKGVYPESCISAASLVIGEVTRPWKVEIEYTTLDGKKKVIRPDEIHSRILLHEIDHLDGKICTDRYNPGTTRLAGGGSEEILQPELKQIE